MSKTRWVHTDRYVVAVEVSLVVPDEDPGEPCLDPEAVQMLREVERRAELGDVAWLHEQGKVYAAIDAA